MKTHSAAAGVQQRVLCELPAMQQCWGLGVLLPAALRRLADWLPAAAVHVLCAPPAAVGEDELRHSLGLATHTTGKGKIALDPNTRAIEVFMCSVVSWGEGGVLARAWVGRAAAGL
jgi:hypothetical protein